MGNRLSRIYTRTGDEGATGLGDGTRRPKDSERLEVIGDVDELNSLLGLVTAEIGPQDPLFDLLREIQQQLFDLGGELSVPGYSMIGPTQVEALEQELDQINAQLPPLKDFILPGGSRAAAYCHLARSVCRRAERHLVALHRLEPVGAPSLAYLNRLSDLLFVTARALARRDGGQEVLWRQRAGRQVEPD